MVTRKNLVHLLAWFVFAIPVCLASGYASGGGAITSFATTAASTMTTSAGSVPLTITLGSGSTDHPFDINAFGGSGGNLFSVASNGTVTMKASSTLDNSSGNGYFNYLQGGQVISAGHTSVTSYPGYDAASSGIAIVNAADALGINYTGFSGQSLDLININSSGNTGGNILKMNASGQITSGSSITAALGFYEPPQTAPSDPATGWVIYTDAGDGNKLKAKASTGTIVPLATP